MHTPTSVSPFDASTPPIFGQSEKFATTLSTERRGLQEDQEALRQREQNLRDYEARLRAQQAAIDARGGASTSPLGDAALESAWSKLHRAREIFEAEQRNLRDDRLMLRELEAQLKRQAEALNQREQMLNEREARMQAAPEVDAGVRGHTDGLLALFRAGRR
jgi:hypothetical protein